MSEPVNYLPSEGGECGGEAAGRHVEDSQEVGEQGGPDAGAGGSVPHVRGHARSQPGGQLAQGQPEVALRGYEIPAQ